MVRRCCIETILIQHGTFQNSDQDILWNPIIHWCGDDDGFVQCRRLLFWYPTHPTTGTVIVTTRTRIIVFVQCLCGCVVNGMVHFGKFIFLYLDTMCIQ